MITLYCEPQSRACREIRKELDSTVLVQRVIVPAEKAAEVLPRGTALPAIVEDGQVYSGREAVARHVREIERLAAMWRKYEAEPAACASDDDSSG
jgi:hypothetical protein